MLQLPRFLALITRQIITIRQIVTMTIWRGACVRQIVNICDNIADCDNLLYYDVYAKLPQNYFNKLTVFS